MRKEGIHPEYFEEAKVFCNGEEVLTVSGAKVGLHNVDPLSFSEIMSAIELPPGFQIAFQGQPRLFCKSMCQW